MEEEEQGESSSSTCVTEESESVSKELEHPWPYLASLFKFIAKAGNTYRFQCLLCQTKTKKGECSAYMNSPSNLKKHLERMHPSHVSQYDEFVAGSRKRKKDNISGQSEKKQRLEQQLIVRSFQSAHSVTQATVNRAIANLVIGALLPLRIVEVQEFRDLITTLQRQRHVICRSTLRTLIVNEASTLKEKLISLLKNQEYVATTTDCWTSYGRSYLGVTVHWIDGETLQRQSAYLALRRLTCSCTGRRARRVQH